MKKIITTLVVVGLSTSLYALPPKIKLDQYMQGANQSIEAKDYVQAQNYLRKIDTLAQNNTLKYPTSYNYFKAKVYLENKKYKEANTYVEKYLNETEDKGDFYRQSLDILNEVEKRLKITYVKTDNLMWQDTVYTKDENKAYAEGYSHNKVQDWQGAQGYCNKLTLEEKSDWRLPTKSQLKTLYKNRSFLVNIKPERYWTSTVPVMNTTDAWSIRFDDGNTNYYAQSNFYYVRCVRDEK